MGFKAIACQVVSLTVFKPWLDGGVRMGGTEMPVLYLLQPRIQCLTLQLLKNKKWIHFTTHIWWDLGKGCSRWLGHPCISGNCGERSIAGFSPQSDTCPPGCVLPHDCPLFCTMSSVWVHSYWNCQKARCSPGELGLPTPESTFRASAMQRPFERHPLPTGKNIFSMLEKNTSQHP